MDSIESQGLVERMGIEIGLNGDDIVIRWVGLTLSIMTVAGVMRHCCQILGSTGRTVDYECPNKVIRKAENIDRGRLDVDDVTSATSSRSHNVQNVSAWLQNFRSEEFDNWGRTYDDVKAGMLHFKQKYFPPNIKSGQSIYESACGIGLNLYMTLEILQEAGITDLKVYGNEYLPASTEKANIVFNDAAPAMSKKGKICVGDSTDLWYVPSNAFDLVYTGYITPLLDPLHFKTGNLDTNYLEYHKLCEAATNDKNWKERKLIALGQEKQNMFYGKWVSEMVRIAKPGSAVIIEQVSYPFCEDFGDWGGVNQSWWMTSIDLYGWDVDQMSLQFENDTVFGNRYHVFMRKNVAISRR